jgi:hypothetical protein
MKKTKLAVLITAASIAGLATADMLVGYDITGTNSIPSTRPTSTVIAGATASGLNFYNTNGYNQAGGGVLGLDTRAPFTVLGANAFSTRGMGNTNWSLAASITANDYSTFTFTPTSGSFNVTNFTARVAYQFPNIGGTGDTFAAYLLSSATGFTVANSLGTASLFASNMVSSFLIDVDLSGVTALQGVNSAVEFRVYYVNTATSISQALGFLGDGNTGTYDVALQGGSVIPEPATFALFGLAGGSILMYRRSRKSASEDQE